MTVKRRWRGGARFVAALAAAAALATPSATRAHPEFSALGTNRYVTVAVFDGRVDVTDARLEGTLASGEERRRLDADGDGRISDAELAAGQERMRAEGPPVTVEVDGRALTAPASVAIDLGDEPRASAAPVVVEHRLSFPGGFPAGARRVRVAIAREPPRLIDTEIGIVVGPGLTLASSEDRVTFQGQRTSTLEERAATFELVGPPPPPRRTLPFVIAGACIVLLAALAIRKRAAGSRARQRGIDAAM
ncbi:MAG TPA: hypothetical protein VLA14_14350 [Polyangia bacterium]|nr:hypothetical protein [Polyangia bacterium]